MAGMDEFIQGARRIDMPMRSRVHEAGLSFGGADKKRREPFGARAAGISHQRGSWLACRREILLNLNRPVRAARQGHPAKIARARKVLFIPDG